MLSSGFVVGGWHGELTIEGDVLTVTSEDGEKSVSVDVKNLKSTAFNSMNGLWQFRLKDGGKVRLQSSGVLLSADRSDAGLQTNAKIRALLTQHGVKGFRA